MLLSEYDPQPALVVERHEVLKPRFPVIDIHNHLGPCFGGRWKKAPPSELLAVLEEAGVRAIVNLDGGLEDNFHGEMEKWSTLGNRVLVFFGVAWKRLSLLPDFGERAAAELESAVAAGAKGLKVWKELGLWAKDESGKLIAVDDPRLDPLWETAGELSVPVMIHVGDPVAFFRPVDRFNERWEELQAMPGWNFSRPGFPAFHSLIEALQKVVNRHSGTTFIGAHVGCYAENLAYVAGMLDRLPNYYVDISARIAELGRQPHTARRFFLRYPDRILFGMDNPPNPQWYRLYYRFLETNDDYFPYWLPDGGPRQGRWYIHGLGLPGSVLERVYLRNAERILRLEPWDQLYRVQDPV